MDVSAKSADGKAVDKLTTTQEVIDTYPTDVWAATLTRVGANGGLIQVAPPAGAILGRGVVDVQLTDTLAPPLAGVRRFMAFYPYDCFEQRLSRAVALGDLGAWQALVGDLPTYQASDGLLRYWPHAEAGRVRSADRVRPVGHRRCRAADPRRRQDQDGRGAEGGARRALAARGFRRRPADAAGGVQRDRARGRGDPGDARPDQHHPQEMPTSNLADYLVALDKVPGLANAHRAQGQGRGGAPHAAGLRRHAARPVRSGQGAVVADVVGRRRIDQGGHRDARPARLERRSGQDDGRRRVPPGPRALGHDHRQRLGHDRGEEVRRALSGGAITGTTMLSLGNQTISRAWPLVGDQRQVSFPLPAGPMPLKLIASGRRGAVGDGAGVGGGAAKQALFAGLPADQEDRCRSASA